jgi:hypothetical protein
MSSVAIAAFTFVVGFSFGFLVAAIFAMNNEGRSDG